MPTQPQDTPVIQKPTPIVLDELLVETTDSNKALYDRMLEKGHYHPNRELYPNYRFVKQAPNTYGLMQYWWANDLHSQDSYNAVKLQAAQDNAYPTFIRSYRVLRAEYLVSGPLTKNLPFTGIASIAVTVGGSDYTVDFPVTFSGGGGSGAEGQAIVDPANGTVLRVEINNVGAGYTSAPTIGFGSGSGTGAAATAVIQPVACVLASEVHSKLDDADPYSSLYDKVTRTWETLPGPIINSTRIDFDGDVVNIASRRKVASTIVDGESFTTGGTVYQKITKQGSDAPDFVATEVVETRPISGNNRPGTDWKFGIAVTTEAQLVKVADAIYDFIGIVGSDWVRKYAHPYDQSEIVAMQFVEKWPLNGPSVPDSEWRSGVNVSIIHQLIPTADAVKTHGIVGSTWVVKFFKSFEEAEDVVLQVTETWALPGQLVPSTDVREGTTLSITTQIIKASDGVTSETEVGSTRVKKFTRPFQDTQDVVQQIVETWALPGTGLVTQPLSEIDGQLVSITETLMLISTISGLGESVVTSNSWQKVTRKKFEDSKICAWRVVETHVIPGAYLQQTKLDEVDKVSNTISRLLVEASTLGDASESYDSSTFIWNKTWREWVPGSSKVAFSISQQRIVPGPVRTAPEYDIATASLVSVSEQLVVTADPLPAWDDATGTLKSVPHEGSGLVSLLTTRTYAGSLSTNLTKETRIDQADGAVITMNRVAKIVGAYTSGDSYLSSVWTRITEINNYPNGGAGFLPDFPVDTGTLKKGWLIETRPLPGPLLSGVQTDDATGISFPYTKRLVPTGAVAGGVTGVGVITLAIRDPGTGFTSNPTLTFSAPPSGGTTATGTATYAAPGVAGSIAGYTLVNGGNNYTTVPTAAVSGGGGSGATLTVVLQGTTVIVVVVTATNASFTDVPLVTFTGGGGGSGASAVANLAPTTVASTVVDAGGSGYTAATVAFDVPRDAIGNAIPGSVAATGTVHLTANVVTSITMDTNGSSYISRPSVTISGDGTGATAHSVLTATSLDTITVTGTGSDYTLVPTVTVSGGGGTATTTAQLAPTSIASITAGAIGSGYSSPTVAVSGGGGSGAIITATLATGTLSTVTITLAGTKYVTAPTVTVSGGGGTGAVVIAAIGSLTYIDVTPVNTVVDFVMSKTVDLATLPVARVFPASPRVQRTSISRASILFITGTKNTTSGMVENTYVGGSGPVKGWEREEYMTDSAFAAYDPGTYSVTGKSFHGTLLGLEQSVSGDDVFLNLKTYSRSGFTLGTSVGVLNVESVKLQLGLRKVTVTYLTQGY